MTQICVVGQHFWSRRLCDTLQRYVPAEVRSHTLHLSNIAAPRTRSALQQADLLVRVGYRPGARTIMGRSFDAFWNLLRTITRHPPVVHYWLGSDVFRTVRDHAGGKLRTRVFESIMNDHHLADAPWLAEELAQVGIRSTVMHIPAPNTTPLGL
jgi:hypothetical protein